MIAPTVPVRDRPGSPTPPEGAAAQGEALAQNLEEQGLGYRYYAALLREQYHALIAGDLAKLAEVNDGIDAAVSELLRLEVDREALVRGFLEDMGLKPRRLTEGWFSRAPEPETPVKCEAIAAHLAPETAARLIHARDALREILVQAQGATRVNAALAENGQRIITATLATMTSIVGRSAGDKLSTYNPRGESQLPRRQVRSLVNRKA